MTTTSNFLIDYYTTVYPTVCQPDSRYLASKEGIKFWSRIVTTCFLPIQILATYCILKKSPESMHFVKSSLLNVNSWCILSGLLGGFVVTPFNFVPYFAGFTIGLATDIGVPFVGQFYIGLAMVYGILISITMLFENRSSLIIMNSLAIRKRRTRFGWILTNYLGSVVLVTPIFFDLPDQSAAKRDILRNLSCPAKEFFTEPFIVIAHDSFWTSYLTIALMFIYLCLMLQILFFSACCIYYLFIFESSQVSPQTRRLQIQSFYGIVGQTLIPLLFVSIPTFVGLDRQKGEKNDQYNNNLMGMSIIMHSGLASLSILLVHKAYRGYLKSLICGVIGKKERKVTVINVSKEGSRRV